jgi:hypothetical protein
MQTQFRIPMTWLAASLAAAGLIAGCGGGDSYTAAANSTSNLSGSVVKGPVSSSDVCFYRIASGAKGDKISCVKTDSVGAYSATLDYVGDVLVEATGGSYTDEATGATTTLGDPLQVVVAAQSGSTVGYVTPLTTVAVSLSKGLSGGMSSTNFGAAAGNVVTQFQLGSVDLAKSKPDVASGTADAYGKALRSISQYIKSGGTLKAFTEFKDPAGLSTAYSGAFKTATGQAVSFAFNGSDKIVIGGTGAGGGSAVCAATVTGSATVSGITVPISYKYCIKGLKDASSCSSGNQSISQAISGQVVGGVNLTTSFSTDCSGSLLDITIQ